VWCNNKGNGGRRKRGGQAFCCFVRGVEEKGKGKKREKSGKERIIIAWPNKS
jgi:hypothetical protein